MTPEKDPFSLEHQIVFKGVVGVISVLIVLLGAVSNYLLSTIHDDVRDLVMEIREDRTKIAILETNGAVMTADVKAINERLDEYINKYNGYRKQYQR